MTTQILSQSRLQELLCYDEHTGLFTWRIHAGNRLANSAAGSLCKRGYLDVSVDGKSYRAHRLAWLYVHGNFPVGVIDHINGNRSDNRITNLRDVTNTRNLLSFRKTNHNNSSGFVGVNKNHNGWRAEIKVNYQNINLGTYPTKEEASIAYSAVKLFLEKKSWIGLTDDEFENIELGCRSTSSGKIEAMRKVEAKLKEKNGLHRQHVIDGSPCWCEPETSYTDPETGASVVVHKEPQ